MKITNHSISNHTVFHQQYMGLIDAKHTLMTDEYMHWCKEDENIERLRSVAEKAVEEYLRAVSSVYFKEERELTEQLCKKKTLF